MLGTFFALRRRLCFVSVSLQAIALVSYRAVSSDSFSVFVFPHIGYPLRHISIPRVVPFRSIPECVSLEYNYVRPS